MICVCVCLCGFKYIYITYVISKVCHVIMNYLSIRLLYEVLYCEMYYIFRHGLLLLLSRVMEM